MFLQAEKNTQSEENFFNIEQAHFSLALHRNLKLWSGVKFRGNGEFIVTFRV